MSPAVLMKDVENFMEGKADLRASTTILVCIWASIDAREARTTERSVTGVFDVVDADAMVG